MRGLLVLSLAVGASAHAQELTKATFNDAIAGKNAFVKFLAPW